MKKIIFVIPDFQEMTLCPQMIKLINIPPNFFNILFWRRGVN
jgi:hypothetical protein